MCITTGIFMDNNETIVVVECITEFMTNREENILEAIKLLDELMMLHKSKLALLKQAQRLVEHEFIKHRSLRNQLIDLHKKEFLDDKSDSNHNPTHNTDS
jgi:archaellum biogenesis ATPase FlaH